MPNIKPTHKAIQTFYAELKQYENLGATSQLPKSKDLGLCEAHAKRPLHKLNGFLQ